MKNGYHSLLILVLICLVPPVSHGNDCLVSTLPPAAVDHYPGVVESKINKKKGYYVATLKNGDQLMAYFAPCELALRAHYFLQSKLSAAELNELTGLFLANVLPAQGDREAILKQFHDQAGEADLILGIVLKGINDSHKISISESQSSFFEKEIHYEWQPPLH